MDNVRSDNEGDKANGRKTDPIAITSFYCVIVFFLFVVFFILVMKSEEPKPIGVVVFLGLALLSAALSVLLGIIAFITIRFSGGRRKGYRLAAVGPVLFIGFPIVMSLWNRTILGRERISSQRLASLQMDFVWIGRILDGYTRDFGECPPGSNMELTDLDDILRNRIIGSDWSKYPNLRDARASVFFTGFPDDPFVGRQHKTLRYYAWQKKNWILWSAGPDRDYDLNEGNIAAVLGVAQDKPTSQSLLAITYDATNGTLSSGDIWFRGEDFRLREQNATAHLKDTDVEHDEFPNPAQPEPNRRR